MFADVDEAIAWLRKLHHSRTPAPRATGRKAPAHGAARDRHPHRTDLDPRADRPLRGAADGDAHAGRRPRELARRRRAGRGPQAADAARHPGLARPRPRRPPLLRPARGRRPRLRAGDADRLAGRADVRQLLHQRPQGRPSRCACSTPRTTRSSGSKSRWCDRLLRPSARARSSRGSSDPRIVALLRARGRAGARRTRVRQRPLAAAETALAVVAAELAALRDYSAGGPSADGGAVQHHHRVRGPRLRPPRAGPRRQRRESSSTRWRSAST